ncbi:MAG TPA: hypothetical protein VFO89_04220, partial [Thermoanaerobaculia bacterium]|nr:hypothetical protein [Thermoanaerobaculia bacterium]
AGRLALIECKWTESPGPSPRGFDEIESLIGAERILSRTIITPLRHARPLSPAVTAANSITLEILP